MSNQLIFSSRVDAVMTSKIIIADKPISQLLKCIASITEFTSCIKNTLVQYSYVSEFTRARIEYIYKDGTTKYKLNIPTETNRFFTFVVCLLTEFDNKRRNLFEFLQEYFTATDNNDSYEKFCDTVLRQFRRAGETILGLEVPVTVDLGAEADAFFAEGGAFISGQTLAQLHLLIGNIKDKIAYDTSLKQLNRNDLLLILNALAHSLQLRKLKFIKVAYIALSAYQLPNYCSDFLSSITKLLTQCNII